MLLCCVIWHTSEIEQSVQFLSSCDDRSSFLVCKNVKCRTSFVRRSTVIFNPLIAILKLHRNGPSYSNTVIDTLAVDGWAVTFDTAERRLGGATAHPGPSWLYQM